MYKDFSKCPLLFWTEENNSNNKVVNKYDRIFIFGRISPLKYSPITIQMKESFWT